MYRILFTLMLSGLLLTARLETGEANLGASMPLESIAACVIGGVSLRGGIGPPPRKLRRG